MNGENEDKQQRRDCGQRDAPRPRRGNRKFSSFEKARAHGFVPVDPLTEGYSMVISSRMPGTGRVPPLNRAVAGQYAVMGFPTTSLTRPPVTVPSSSTKE